MVEDCPKALSLLQVMRREMRLRHMSPYTEESYLGWVRRYLRFILKRHPRDVGTSGIISFFSTLAERRYAAASQNQALNSLVFLYREVLDMEVGELKGVKWISEHKNIPTVLSREEVALLLGTSGKYSFYEEAPGNSLTYLTE